MLDGRTFDADEACLRERFASPRYRERRAYATRVPGPVRARAWLRRRRLRRAPLSAQRRRLPRPSQEDGNRPRAHDRGAHRSDVLLLRAGADGRRTRPSGRARRAARRGASDARDRLLPGTISSPVSPSQPHSQKLATLPSHCATPSPTFAATTHDCKRVAKEADSAWLRFGPEPQRFDAASDPRTLQPNTVMLWSDAALENDRSIAETIAVFSGFRGHLAIDEASGAATPVVLAAAMRRWRTAFARVE